jgi:cytochrome c-type biogenesis protein
MVASGQQSYASSAVMGMIFVAGWTPCIGPVYGAVLTMAANGGEVSHAGVLLMAYSLGLGIPFLLTSLLLDSAQAVLRRLRPHMRKIELFSGVFLIVMGIAIASGQLQTISQQFAGQFADFSTRVETCVLDWVQGERPLNDVGPCINNPKN